jgi:hypothetical protein
VDDVSGAGSVHDGCRNMRKLTQQRTLVGARLALAYPFAVPVKVARRYYNLNAMLGESRDLTLEHRYHLPSRLLVETAVL